MLLLRWVLIIATSYLVLFSHPVRPLGADLFVAAYLASNIVLRVLLPRMPSEYFFDVTVVLFDATMVSVGLAITGTASSQFFVMYFVVVFLSALTERLELVVGAAVLISATHLYGMAQFVGLGPLLSPGYALRIPFLFAVALFFGHLVGEARNREREAEDSRTRELRREFLSTFSHDLKNPLGVIQALATLLLDGDGGPLTERQRRLAQRLHATTQHVVTLALNLIDAARIDAGWLVLQRRATNLANVVEDVLLLARNASDIKNVALHWTVAPNLPFLYVDPVQVERVITNLVGNAIKFTPAEGTVSVSVGRVAADEIVLEVRDNGAGIPPSELPLIFEKYRCQAPSSPIEGSGLGLFIVEAIVKAHGGRIAIGSTVGQGTTVTVHFPIRPVKTDAATLARSGQPELVPHVELTDGVPDAGWTPPRPAL
ncbi:MAG: sensor histidine kinase [Candidatus Binatia bacterium]